MSKIIPIKEICSISLNEIKDFFMHVTEVTAYKGILIVWDEDFDTRILSFIDESPYTKNLVACGEHEGHLTLVYKEKMFSDQISVDIDVDTWTISTYYLLTK